MKKNNCVISLFTIMLVLVFSISSAHSFHPMSPITIHEDYIIFDMSGRLVLFTIFWLISVVLVLPVLVWFMIDRKISKKKRGLFEQEYPKLMVSVLPSDFLDGRPEIEIMQSYFFKEFKKILYAHEIEYAFKWKKSNILDYGAHVTDTFNAIGYQNQEIFLEHFLNILIRDGSLSASKEKKMRDMFLWAGYGREEGNIDRKIAEIHEQLRLHKEGLQKVKVMIVESD